MTPEQIAAYKRMTPDRRVAAGCALHDFAFRRLVLHLRRKHPAAPESEIVRMAARRFLGDAARVL